MSSKLLCPVGGSLLQRPFSLLGPVSSCRWMSTPSDNAQSLNNSNSNSNGNNQLFNIARGVVPAPIRTTSISPKAKLLGRRQRITQRGRIMEETRNLNEGRTLEKFQTREWKHGDLYSPHDLSPSEMKKWGKRLSPSTDAFDALSINPLEHYKNFSIMSEYMTPMGRIRHRSDTGLRPVNQRKIAKAIRRAIGVGLMPSVHHHPEIIAHDTMRRGPASKFNF